MIVLIFVKFLPNFTRKTKLPRRAVRKSGDVSLDHNYRGTIQAQRSRRPGKTKARPETWVRL